VDVVDTGRALITTQHANGYVGRDHETGSFYVEDVDTEEIVGHARTYAQAGRVFARHKGIEEPEIEVEHE
jgi:hypothetical protein